MQKKEKEIINIIKYVPSIFVIFISALVTFYLYNQNQINLKNETEKLESNYIQLNKEQIQYQVKRIKEQVEYEKTIALNDLKETLKLQIDNSYKILSNIYEEHKDLPKEKMFSKIKKILKNIRFNDNRSYIFIYTLDGTNIFHPEKKYLENKNLWNAKDEKGTAFMQEMNKILTQKDETFYSWYWKKDDNSSKAFEKIGYFKKFEPLNIFIGAGEYVDDFESKLKNRLIKSISDFKFDKNGYIFIINYDGVYLGYYDKSFIGKTVYQKSFNPDIYKTFELMKTAARKGDFLSYYHTIKPDKEDHERNIYKYSYVDNIKDWDWIIGTGFYMDDFYENLEKKKLELNSSNNSSIKKILLVSFIMTLFILVIFINISNILESKFQKYQADIQKQIKDNIKKDNIMAHQSKMAAMGEMIGNIAHQWRQPLSTISTIVTGMKMQKELGVLTQEDEIESLTLVNKHVQYLSTTIDDFRDFFKPQKIAKKFDIQSAFDKAIGLVKVQFNSKSIEIFKDIEHVELNSLENELIQVLINILNNARDELVKKQTNRYIFVNVKKCNKNLEIFIKDNAGGIPNEVLTSIFEPYFTTKSTQNGTGIGLFMSEEIVKKHLKGNIFVSNDSFNYDGKNYHGAVFKIILPLNI